MEKIEIAQSLSLFKSGPDDDHWNFDRRSVGVVVNDVTIGAGCLGIDYHADHKGHRLATAVTFLRSCVVPRG